MSDFKRGRVKKIVICSLLFKQLLSKNTEFLCPKFTSFGCCGFNVVQDERQRYMKKYCSFGIERIVADSMVEKTRS